MESITMSNCPWHNCGLLIKFNTQYLFLKKPQSCQFQMHHKFQCFFLKGWSKISHVGQQRTMCETDLFIKLADQRNIEISTNSKVSLGYCKCMSTPVLSCPIKNVHSTLIVMITVYPIFKLSRVTYQSKLCVYELTTFNNKFNKY